MHQEQYYSLIPRYENVLCRHIGVLQQIQVLLGSDTTLHDVAQLVQSLQQEFGIQEQLEQVIQLLVSRSLEEQLSRREQRRQKAS